MAPRDPDQNQRPRDMGEPGKKVNPTTNSTMTNELTLIGSPGYDDEIVLYYVNAPWDKALP